METGKTGMIKNFASWLIPMSFIQGTWTEDVKFFEAGCLGGVFHTATSMTSPDHALIAVFASPFGLHWLGKNLT
eukprot:4372816-Amphidinium_carterae.1